MDSPWTTIGFVGAGRAASALAVGLAQQGYQVVAVASRTRASAERLARRIPTATAVADAQTVADTAELVFITTPDDAIAQIAADIVWRPGQAVLHCSGTLTLAPLAAAAAKGVETGSFHPVHTFNAEGSPGVDALRGAAYGIEAQGPLFEALAEMARRLGGTPIWVPAEARGLYHAAAVMVCGYFVGLFDDAVNVWRSAGLPPDSVSPALTHLVQATLDNLGSLGAEASQTGPVPRGDAGTVKAHLDALRRHAPELQSVYAALARRAVALAVSSGRLPEAARPQWEELLTPSGVSERGEQPPV